MNILHVNLSYGMILLDTTSALWVPFITFPLFLFFDQIKDGAGLLIKDIFSPVCDYAGNEDLDKSYWNLKRKLGVTTHFSKIIPE